MPYRDQERQREYARLWRANRRAEWFKDKTCAECGSTENLELDHIDSKLKIDHKIWSWSAARRDVELAKCQVLCHDCHVTKTKTHRDWNSKRTKLSEDNVRAIRASSLSYPELAVQYGVSRWQIGLIHRGQRWKDLE